MTVLLVAHSAYMRCRVRCHNARTRRLSVCSSISSFLRCSHDLYSAAYPKCSSSLELGSWFRASVMASVLYSLHAL